jgi:hypothetical protein
MVLYIEVVKVVKLKLPSLVLLATAESSIPIAWL